MVVDAVLERDIDRVVFSLLRPNLVHVTSSGEEVVAKFVEGDSHYTIGEVERFLYAVAMVNININVEYSRMVPGIGNVGRGGGGENDTSITVCACTFYFIPASTPIYIVASSPGHSQLFNAVR